MTVTNSFKMEEPTPLERLANAATFEKLFKELIRYAVGELEARRAIVVFDNQKVSKPEARSYYGFNSDVWSGKEVQLAVLERVLKLGKADCIGDTNDVADLEDRTKAIMSQSRSVLCLPLISGGRSVLGALYVDHSQPHHFGKEHREKAQKAMKAFSLRHTILVQEGEEKVAARIPKPVAYVGGVLAFLGLLVFLSRFLPWF